MVNTEEFAKRIQKIIEYYGETASSFAEKIGVQRSSISHVLSGRNKPSLEFVLKVVSSYQEVELYWLLNGKGEFPSGDNLKLKKSNFSSTSAEIKNNPSDEIDAQKSIERIVIFYSDGSFKSFQN
ncbi:helix-turn-helix transcriptional regulator [Algibacter aquimarinus]